MLVDLDVEEPNDHLFIKGKLTLIKDQHRYVPVWNEKNCVHCGNCRNVCEFNAIAQLPEIVLVYPELCHSCFACAELCDQQALEMIKSKMGVMKRFKISDHLSLVESTLNIGEISAVPLIKQTREYVNSMFSDDTLKILDCPPGTSCPVIESVKHANLVILVTEPTWFGLHDLQLAAETMQQLKQKFIVVINKYEKGNTLIEDYCQDNNFLIGGRIPLKREIAELASEGEMLYTAIPEVKREINNIIAAVYSVTEHHERNYSNIG